MQGKFDGHGGSATGTIFRLQAAGVIRHDPLADREAESRAVILRRDERFEQSRQDVVGNPRTGVLESNASDRRRFVRLDVNVERAGGGYRLDAVEQQVDADLMQLLGVRVDPHRFGGQAPPATRPTACARQSPAFRWPHGLT